MVISVEDKEFIAVARKSQSREKTHTQAPDVTRMNPVDTKTKQTSGKDRLFSVDV